MLNRNRGRNGKGYFNNPTALKEKINEGLKYTEEQAENIRDYIKSIELEREIKQHRTELLVTGIGLLAFIAGMLFYMKKR